MKSFSQWICHVGEATYIIHTGINLCVWNKTIVDFEMVFQLNKLSFSDNWNASGLHNDGMVLVVFAKRKCKHQNHNK